MLFVSSNRRHTSCALVTGVQTCALPSSLEKHHRLPDRRHRTTARKAGDRGADARLRRQLGQHAGDGLWNRAPRTLREPDPARHLSGRARGSALSLSGQCRDVGGRSLRSEEHTSELQSLMRISYAVFCLKKKTKTATIHNNVM